MARIRTIKPEFFTSEDIVSVSPLARLFYVSLWCEAGHTIEDRWVKSDGARFKAYRLVKPTKWTA